MRYFATRWTGLKALFTALLTLSLWSTGSPAADLPGKGVTVQPLKSSIAEETFQTLLVMKALERLGYEVKPIKEVEYATAHVAIGNGDGTFLADHWDPLHVNFYTKGRRRQQDLPGRCLLARGAARLPDRQENR